MSRNCYRKAKLPGVDKAENHPAKASMRTTPFLPPLPFAERAAVSFGNVLQAARQSQKRIPPLSAGANPRRAGPVTAPIERHSVWLCNSGGTVEHLPLHPVVL